MAAVHSPSSSGHWPDPRQRGYEHRARHDDVAPETSWGYPAEEHSAQQHRPGTRYEAVDPTAADVWSEGRLSRGASKPAWGTAEAGGGERTSSWNPAQDFGHGQGDPPGTGSWREPAGESRGWSESTGDWQSNRTAAWLSSRHDHPAPVPAQPSDVPEQSGEPSDVFGRSTGKAGRNLPMAIAVGVLLGAAVIASLYVWRPAFVLLAALAIMGAIWEMARAVEPVEARPPLVPLLLGGPAIVGLAWFAGLEAMVLGLVLTVVAVLVWRLGEGPVGYQRDVTFATLIVTYVAFLAGFAVLLVKPDDGAFRVTITLAAAVLSDVGGYATGALFGRHPMAPTVSPKKSWEGFAGSVSASAVGSAILLALMLDVPWWQGVLFGVGIALAATLGDLGESLMKRDLGIKDMGRLLPGHGGLMDRLDSLLLAVPTGYLLLVSFAPPGV